MVGEKVQLKLREDVLKFQRIYHDSMNRAHTEYLLERELTDTLLTGYSAVLRRKVIARWRELEGAVAAPELPNFADTAAARRQKMMPAAGRRQGGGGIKTSGASNV